MVCSDCVTVSYRTVRSCVFVPNISQPQKFPGRKHRVWWNASQKCVRKLGLFCNIFQL